jgi:hypothetical protein
MCPRWGDACSGNFLYTFRPVVSAFHLDKIISFCVCVCVGVGGGGGGFAQTN